MTKLHLGCGRTRLDGWLNVDAVEIPGVTDLVSNLDGAAALFSLDDDSVDESLGIHFLEHLDRPLDFMAALYRVTKPGGTVTFEVPYGSSDDAWEDPTHRRPYFANSWVYFAQPNYHRADYSYAADWRTISVDLGIDMAAWGSRPTGELPGAIRTERNVVKTMTATLDAVKPARPADAELREPLSIRVVPA